MSDFIRETIAAALGGEAGDLLPLLDGVLTAFTPGVRTGGAASSGTNPTPTAYPIRGFVKAFKDGDIDGTVIRQNDRMVSIIGADLPAGVVPEVGNKIAIGGFTYRIVGGDEGRGVSFGAAQAMYRCHGRR